MVEFSNNPSGHSTKLDNSQIELSVMRVAQQHRDLCQQTGADCCITYHHGQIIQEDYWNGKGEHNVVPLMSCTKSVCSILLGIMIDRQMLSLDTKVSEFIPEWDSDNSNQVTLRHLLTHTSGLALRLDADGQRQSIGYVEDKSSFIRALAPENPVGSQFSYSNEGVQLLGMIMHQRLVQQGDSLDRFAERELFSPLGISSAQFRFDPSGCPWTYGDLRMTPRDFLKFGILVSQEGRYAGKQVVSREWVQESVRTQVDTNQSDGIGGRAGCGYLWWTFESVGLYAALGYKNTNMYIIPKADLILIRTQESGEENSYFLEAISVFNTL